MKAGNIKPRPSVYNLRSNNNRMPRTKNLIGWEGLDPSNRRDNYEEDPSDIEESPTKQNVEYSPKYIPESMPYPRTSCRIPESIPYPSSSEPIPQTQELKESKSHLMIIISFVILSVLALLCLSKEDSSGSIAPSKDDDFLKAIKNLRKTFPTQKDALWENFYSGIKEIHAGDPRKPSVFLLLHADDSRTSECLVQKFAYQAVKFLGENSPEPIFIRGKQIKMNSSLTNDYGLFMSTYKTDIEKRHVMVVYELEEIPPVVAQTFHSLCDVENPTVKEAAYIFTLKVDKDFEYYKPRHAAENVLRALWSRSLPIDIRDPLIIRVANIVSFIKHEDTLQCED